MLDFRRIGGEITSAPLNENFRRLRNDISIANTNLVFPEMDAIVANIDEMKQIKDAVNGQTCYTVSSGELYRYSTADGQWHKIADFGQTFRQGFLNSGAVVLEDKMKLKEKTKSVLVIPKMLVYFKNKKGDDRYLKGMYLFNAQEIDISTLITSANAYSIFMDSTGKITLVAGRPKKDSPNLIYLGTVLVNSKKEILPQFIYTLPNIAYTADRGHFLLDGGQASGLNLTPGADGKKVNRKEGFYYDEGANYTIGSTDNYPIDTDNGSNYNLKYQEGVTPVEELYYVTPINSLNNSIEVATELIIDKYWDGEKIASVPEGQFTIQQHLITPNGQNIIIYGSNVYNSLNDALSNINQTYGLTLSFPYAEVTRVIVGNLGAEFNVQNPAHCTFFTMGRLSQVGTISPEFADDQFKIYSGDMKDNIPSSMRFSLSELQKENYDDLLTLTVAPFHTTRHYFANEYKYITDDNIEKVSSSAAGERIYNNPGYLIADNQDLELLRQRVNAIEEEIWATEKENPEEYVQSIRYRLFQDNKRLNTMSESLVKQAADIVNLKERKVNKSTKVNGYTLGDNYEENESKEISIFTGDINEGMGLTESTNLWYTEARVSNNADVVASKEHRNLKSVSDSAVGHTKINPHNLSTDDIDYLTDTTKVFVTPEEERRIRSDKLPEDTKKAIADLDAKNIDSVKIESVDGSSLDSTGTITDVGNVKNIRFYEDGVSLGLTEDKNTLTVECKGQINEKRFMLKNEYAQQSVLEPETLKGYVDKSISANTAVQISGIEAAGNDKYYGTNESGIPGIYDIKEYVTTVNSDSFADIDQVTFVPIDGSVQEKHLEIGLRNKINNNYHVVYNSGTISSSEINEFNFGNNLEVSVNGHKATINATGSGSGAGVSNFTNLTDVNVVYTGNKGKSLVINAEENGIEIADTPSLDNYMLKTVYVDPLDITKIKKARMADKATLAESSNNASKVNNKTVNDGEANNTVLWTAAKIKENTTSQIQAETVHTYSGTTVPSTSLGKNGDLFILTE